MISKRQLYAMGETFGDSATRTKPGGRVYGGGGSGGQTTTNSVDPRFDQIINYATKAAGRVENAGFTPYTDQRYSGINSTQRVACSGGGRGNQPCPVRGTSRNFRHP